MQVQTAVILQYTYRNRLSQGVNTTSTVVHSEQWTYGLSMQAQTESEASYNRVAFMESCDAVRQQKGTTPYPVPLLG
jgi:hypothetical protein